MKHLFTSILFFVTTLSVSAQDNCNVFKWEGDTCRYEACKFLEESPGFFQLTKEYHQIKDKAIEICPEYAVVYKHKSTAYLKTGDFIGWKKLIDKAVELDPLENIDYRGWCRFQFFGDYEGAIADIEELERISKSDIGYCQNGHYHLVMAKALCYKMIGQPTKAIELMESQIEKDATSVGLYDYLHLGVLYMELKDYDKAIEALNKQINNNALAEAYYYLAMVYKSKNNRENYRSNLKIAEERYAQAHYMLDPYTHHVDKVYYQDIINEIEKGF